VPVQRTTWKYFVQRCLVEGKAKAVLTDLAGPKDGLGAEKRYVREVLPRAVASALGAAMCGDVGAAWRAGAIIAGFALTAFAYITTRLSGAAEVWSQHLLSLVRVRRA
jgi:hypothetical protein